MSNGNFFENFNDIANWTNNFATGVGANRWGSVAINSVGTIPDGRKTTASTATFPGSSSSSGVQRGTGAIMLLSTGTTDNSSAVAIDLFLDFTNVTAGTLSFDWSEVTNGSGNRRGSVRIYTSADGTIFSELTDAAILNVVNNIVSSGSITNVPLPASFNNSSTARIRFYYHNGTGGSSGNRPKISIDNISVSGIPVLTVTQLTNGIAASPLTGNHTNKAIIGFSLQGGSPQNFTAIDFQTSSTSIGKLANIKVFKSIDNDYSTSGDNSQVTGLTINQTATEIQISGFSETLSDTPTNFFLVSDINLTVTRATPNVRLYFTELNITVSAGTIDAVTVTGNNYSFQPAFLLDNMEASAINYIEGDAATAITATTTASASASNLTSGIVQIKDNYQKGEDVLSFINTNGINGSWDASTGTMTLYGAATVANYQTAIRSISYQNTSQNPSTLQRTVTFSLNDSTSNSNTVTRNILITAVNNAPVLAGVEALDFSYTAGTAKQITNSITVSDVDNTAIAGATVQITGNYSNDQDVLLFTNQRGITGTWTSTTGTLNLKGITSISNYQAALRSIQFQNTSLNASSLLRTVSFTVNDGSSANNTSIAVSRNISVNNTPVIAAIEGTQLNYTAGDPPTLITGTITINDVDNLNLASAVIQMSSYYEWGNDVLSFTNAYGITGSWNATSGILTLTGNSSLANYQAAIRSVKYYNLSTTPVKLIRTINFSVNDGLSDSNILTREINLGFTLPVLSGIETDTLLYKQGDGEINITNGLTISSPSSPMLSSAIIQITGNYQQGEDALVCLNQNQIVAEWHLPEGKINLSWPSSIANYQTALRSVTYKNTSNKPNNLPRTISFVIGDGYNSSNTVSRPINVSVLNTITLATNISEGGTVSGGGIFYSGNSITVTATPNTGYAFVNWTEVGTAVSVNQSYTFKINSDRSLTANFVTIQCTLTTSSIPNSGGSTSGSGIFNFGTPVCVTATPNAGYTFVNWTSGSSVVSNLSAYTFTINGSQNLAANFMMLPILNVTPDFVSVGPIAGTASIHVSNSGGGTMNWSSTSDIFWIKITSGSSGTNNGIINISYNHNNSAPRVGTVTITAAGVSGSPKSIEIRQGEPVTYVEYLNLGIPDTYRLEQNYPNPFNPTTKIRYGLPKESNVVVTVYNILGEEAARIVNEVQGAGLYEVNFDANKLTSGIYIYRISAGSFTQIRKMILIK